MRNWDLMVDFLVVGSGGGGMAAAITASDHGLKSLVIEKSEYYGGTTAISGGVIWIPNNHHMKEVGINDSQEEGYRYLKQLTAGEVSDKRLRAYVQEGPEMLKYMERNTLVKYASAPSYTDYYPELDGGKTGGRSLDPDPYSRRKLGKIDAQLRPQTHGEILDRFTLTAKEAHAFLNFSLKTYFILFKRLGLFYLDIPRRLKKLPDNRLTLGSALVGRLRKSMEDRDIPLWLNTSAESLIIESGKVIGLVVEKEGKTQRIKVNNGVLFACGGFAHNDEMRKKYQAHPVNASWSVACPTNTGDGIIIGEKVGARLGFMSKAWWTPVMTMPRGRVEALIIGKSMPGCILVNKKGKRFTNDAASYEDVIKGQYAAHSEESPSIPCYLVFDARYRHNYSLGRALGPGKAVPDSVVNDKLIKTGWLKKARTLEALAKQLEIDAEGLISTIKRFNGFAETGKDLDFGRGDSLSDRYYSDHSIIPNSCIAPIETAPFYAIEIFPGDLGTKGGLVSDEYARVLDKEDKAIEGLYVTGNCSASVMGDSYPGAGSTIGPSMTFGYIAAKHAAGTYDT